MARKRRLLSRDAAISDRALNALSRLPAGERRTAVRRASARALRLRGPIGENGRAAMRVLDGVFGPVGGAW